MRYMTVASAHNQPDPKVSRDGGHPVLGASDVAASRERQRQRRLARLGVGLLPIAVWLWFRGLTEQSLLPQLPEIDWVLISPVLFFIALIGVLVGTQLGAGRSPHVSYRPEQIDVGLDDVVGIDHVVEDVRRSLDLFRAHATFAETMGGTPRRGLLFEGPPGTGKTLTAKAMAREAGVPFLFVSATSFQSMYYGATARKIRSYFKELRKAARAQGGAIGFIEEIDAIATSRSGLAMVGSQAAAWSTSGQLNQLSCCGPGLAQPSFAVGGTGILAGIETGADAGSGGLVRNALVSEGVGGVVNELLVQMQSFDAPLGSEIFVGWFIDRINLFLPPHRQLRSPARRRGPILLIAATNRAEALDPALLRPGRFDRRLTFDLPAMSGRRALLDHFLATRSHHIELDDELMRDQLAAATQGYSPVMIEHLLDEALVNAVRRGSLEMNRADVEHARLVEEIGLGTPAAYGDRERHLIATHEAGHAVTAWLVAPHRRLEVLSIIKRRGALGLLAHGDREEVFTRSREEMKALLQIALAGQVAEELFIGDVSTGPGGDLVYATTLAAQMVGSVGMAESLVSFDAVPDGFGSGTSVSRVLGDTESRRQVEALLQEQRAAARTLLARNTHLVAALRDELAARQELIGHEITDVLVRAACGQQARAAAALALD